MRLNHIYQTTPHLQELQIEITANKKALSLLPQNPEQIASLRHISLLHSGLYSARIEGNPLTPATFPHTKNKLAKLEVSNLTSTLSHIFSHPTTLSLPLIRNLHKQALHNLHSDAGQFRTEMSAIYNSAGIAVYLTPPPEEIIPTLTQMIKTYVSSQNPLLSAMIFHYQFEKLHPFVDGNGRVGRLLLSQALFTHSYSLNGTITLDQQIEARRSGYYDTLARENKDLTPFLEYMLECLLTSQNLALKSLVSSTPNSTHMLSPRRAELLETIRDHAPCSFDFLHRRFYAVKPSTLHYDLQQLEKKGLIHKLGTTRGALYSDLAPE